METQDGSLVSICEEEFHLEQFSLPLVTPWPIPLPTPHQGLRIAAQQAEVDFIFSLWDRLAESHLASTDLKTPSVFTIITVGNKTWFKLLGQSKEGIIQSG